MLSQPGLRNVNLQKVRLFDRIEKRKPDLANELRGLKLDWFTIRNQVDEETEVSTADVFIYDEIGGSMGVSAMDFIEQLGEIDTDEIVVRINSPGGLLIDGIAIGSALAQHPARIITRVDGIAASAASIVAMSGDVCEMMSGSQLMIHDVLCTMTGNAKDMRETAAWLEEQSQNVAAMYARKAGGEPEEWRSRMLAETWMFAEEAVELRLADSIYERVNKGFPVKEDPEKEDPEDPDEESPEEEEESEDDIDEELENLMTRAHRLTNRGYKYSGRNKAPNPLAKPSRLQPARNMSDAALDQFAAAMNKVLGGTK